MKLLLPILLLAMGCTSLPSNPVKNTKWQLYSFTERPSNRLDEMEKTLVKGFNEDSVENKVLLDFNSDTTFQLSLNSPNGETSLYQYKKDTLFIASPDKTEKDTFVVALLSNDLLHVYNLRGLDCKFKRVQ